MKLAWKQIIVALTVGALLGGFATLKCPLARHGWDHNPEKFHQKMMEEFSSKLNLNAEQKEKISSILKDTQAKMEVLRKETHPKFREIRDSSRAQIREILNPEQQKEFDILDAKMNSRFEKWRGKSGSREEKS